MDNNDKISISKLAKYAKVSVRTLQYYDQIGLLKPSVYSESKGRLYTENDIALLHQIVTLKSFGLSLDEIKNKINPVNNNDDVLDILTQQSYIINEQISKSRKILESIEMIKKEIVDSKIVDWSKYSDMMSLINENNEYYWVVNYLEKDMLKKIEEVYKKDDTKNKSENWLKEFLSKALELDRKNISYDSDEAQILASKWWYYMKKYTGGDEYFIKQLYNFYGTANDWPDEYNEFKDISEGFLEKIIGYYLEKNNITFDIPKQD